MLNTSVMFTFQVLELGVHSMKHTMWSDYRDLKSYSAYLKLASLSYKQN